MMMTWSWRKAGEGHLKDTIHMGVQVEVVEGETDQGHQKEKVESGLRLLYLMELNIVKIGATAAFFVQNESAANALKKVNNTITTRDGSKVMVLVKNSDPPHPPRGRGRGRG